VVFVYAAAMAWVEAAVVFYLRTLVGRIDPYQATPLPVSTGLGSAELVREAATLIMLLTVGILAGRSWRGRLGYAAIAFGVWDILYYVFLRVICGWPHSLLDWDVLFLLPLPWWGPVLAPVLISVLLIAWGILASRSEEAGPADWKACGLGFAGALVALYVFMADAIRVAGQGEEALRNLLPSRFNWPLFCVALVLMTVPILQMAWRLRSAPAVPLAAAALE
jgi:hypothetical protein